MSTSASAFSPETPWNTGKKGTRFVQGALIALLGTWAFVTNETTDLTGRIVRASQNRPDIIRHEIGSYWDRDFVSRKLLENSKYYVGKWITADADNEFLTDSLTRLDIAVRLFQEWKLSVKDLLHFILLSPEKIVTGVDVIMDTKASINGSEFRSISWDDLHYDSNTLTDFFEDVMYDRNNAQKRELDLQITPREWGGGYIFSFTVRGQQFRLRTGFSLVKTKTFM